ncbi:MAG: MBL fold metallo-hydrolase, partial [Anaeromyxobacteraceae bacterium]
MIKHGDDYLIWDTGYTPGSNPNATKVSLGEQLSQLKIRPEQVKYVGISHFHADHTGQLDTVPNATLLIGQKEWDAITAPKPMSGANVAGFKHWISDGGKVEPQAADKDVFGDGTVMILRTPGHTPGHQSLLVRLKEKGPVVLVGDAVHFPRELRIRRRAGLQLRPRRDHRLHRAHQADREEPEGDRHHPVRSAGHRQATGVSERRPLALGALTVSVSRLV